MLKLKKTKKYMKDLLVFMYVKIEEEQILVTQKAKFTEFCS